MSEHDQDKFLHEFGRLFFEFAPDPIFVLNVETHFFVEVNQAACNHSGYSRSELLNMGPKDIDSPVDQDKIPERIAQLIRDRKATFETIHIHRSGKLIPVEMHIRLIEHEGRTYTLNICRDVSERRRIEEKLLITQFVSDHAPDSILWLDKQARIVYANEVACRERGYSNEDMLAMSVADIDPDARIDLWPDHWQELQQKGNLTFERRHRRKDGSTFPIEVSANFVKFGDQEFNVTFSRDISGRKAAEREINSLAFYDSLTRLPNRRLLMDRLKQALASSVRSGLGGALLFIDLDNFKALNDTLGHEIGDLLLQQVARRLESCVREGDTVARLGGDEFVVMLEDLSERSIEAAAQAETVCGKIQAGLAQPYLLATQSYLSTASIGVTLFSNHKQSQDDLLKQADIAMYQAKKAGRNALCFFDPQMQDTITARASLEFDLRSAIAKQEQFQLHYQAQVDISGRLVGVEALLRWQHPVHGFVSPAEFIVLAEESGLILPLGHWVLRTACRQLAAWAAKPETAHLTMAVNISAKQFGLSTFVEEVLTLVEHYQFDASKLKLEITEGMLLNNIDEIIVKMDKIKAKGVRFSMDDFGTGYSSLQYLKRLPLDQLKIDQSFVRDIANDSSDRAIVRTVIAMAQGLDLEVIAEGVETEVQRNLLINKGCTHFQGYLFGKPLPVEQFEALLHQA